MRKKTALGAVLAVILATLPGGGPVGAQASGDLSQRNGPVRVAGSVADFDLRSPDDVVQVFIQLDEPSVAEFAADTGAGRAAQRAQGAAVLSQQRRLRSDLATVIVEERSNLVVGANGLRVMVRAGDIPAIRAADGVESVAAITRYHLTNDTSVPWIGGHDVRDAGFTGDGVTIAVIDTGIDYTHASFAGSGLPADYENNDKGVIEVGTFPTAKVVNGFDFAGPIYDASSDDPTANTPQPDPDPLDGNGHGTHVAATAAGIDPLSDPLEEGMAQDASVMALKVFGDTAGSTDVVSDAIEFALDPNNDLSTDDAADVINMSLGSDFGHPDDPSAIASQNAVDAGVVVVASAGNSADVPYVTGSPAVADGVISVAASVDGGVTLLGMTVNSPLSIAGDYEAAAGDFGSLDPDTTGDLAIADPLDACTPLPDMTGEIAFIQRGTCEFTVKIRNAEDAGAIGALVFNNADGPPIGMAHNGTEPKPTIPAVMISLEDGEDIGAVAAVDTVNVTLSDDVEVPRPDLADTMAGFTSRGPGFGSVFKPDVSAPGFSIRSAAVGTGDGAALNSGTSMASPHVAGAAAQLLEAYPAATPAQVKAMLMNSARPALPDGDVAIAAQGTGVIQIDRAALDVGGYASPGGLSFGRLNPTTSGTTTRTVDVTRLTGEATYDVELITNQTLPGVDWDISATTVATSSGSGSVDVSLTVDPAAMDSDDGFFSQAESDGWVRFTNQADPTDTMVVGLLAVVDPASTVAATGGEDTVSIVNTGPGDGFADGYTLIAEGDATTGSFDAIGYRTSEDVGFDVIEFGLALDEWSHPSSLEVDIFINTDGDPDDEYVLVAADLGLLQGGDPTGQWVTALLNLATSDFLLEYFAIADLNDGVADLPVDLTGDFGFNPSDTFEIDVAVFDQLGLSGLAEDLTVDLTTEVTSEDGLSLFVPAGAGGDIATEGAGEMLWLYANNAVGDQFSTTTVTTAEEAPPTPPPPPPPPGEPPSFDDVPDDHLFAKEIAWLALQGITRSCNPPDNTLFCPADDVTRGQMAAFLNRALQLAPTTEDFFADDEGNIFEGDINELAAAGITKGCNPPVNNEFCPERTLTRAEMATFMVRGYSLTEGAGDDLFVDDDTSVHEADIDILGTAGITRGCNPPTNTQYCPERNITRGEMAAFLYRAFQATGLGGG
jgi:minor extracellular serine protease Vpr